MTHSSVLKRGLPAVGLLLVLALAACAPAAPEASQAAGAPGFWQGLWHGLISPVTFLVSLFNDKVGICEVSNSGSWSALPHAGGTTRGSRSVAATRTLTVRSSSRGRAL